MKENKLQINEKEAALLFIDNTCVFTKKFWEDGLAADIGKVLSLNKNLKEDVWSLFYFTHVFIALQMDTLFHVLPKEQAIRIRRHVYDNLWPHDIVNRDDARDTVEKFEKIVSDFPNYDNGFPVKTAYHIPPLANVSEAIGVGLSDYLDLDLIIEVNGEKFYNIASICILGDVFILCSKSWNWKIFLEKVELIME